MLSGSAGLGAGPGLLEIQEKPPSHCLGSPTPAHQPPAAACQAFPHVLAGERKKAGMEEETLIFLCSPPPAFSLLYSDRKSSGSPAYPTTRNTGSFLPLSQFTTLQPPAGTAWKWRYSCIIWMNGTDQLKEGKGGWHGRMRREGFVWSWLQCSPSPLSIIMPSSSDMQASFGKGGSLGCL